LDGLCFTTAEVADKLTTDNSYVYETYINRDTGLPAVCYGRIQSIIEHQVYPGAQYDHVLIECDWYSPTGVTTPSGLLQVNYDAELSRTSRWTFLKDMYRSNVILWPSYSHTPSFHRIPATFTVVQHHATLADAAEGDGEEDDNESEDKENDE
jgi:hypothetical protein